LLLQVLVGFADKLRLMNVLMDDVKVIKEVRGPADYLKEHPSIIFLQQQVTC
jgi:hypothetical protein